MKAKYTTISSVLAAVALGLLSFSAHAVLLNPGDIAPLPGTTVAAEPQLAGNVLVDEIIPFSIGSGSVTGTVQQRVVQSSVDNTIDFYWRVFNSANSTDSIDSFRIANFVSPEYNVNWAIDGLGDIAPDLAHRFSGTEEADVNFLFSNGIAPGLSSRFFFFDTTATQYSKTAIFDLTSVQSGISGSHDAYTPTTSVPEPATYALLSLGLVGIGFSRRKKVY